MYPTQRIRFQNLETSAKRREMEHLYSKREAEACGIFKVQRVGQTDLAVRLNPLDLLIPSKLNKKKPPRKNPKWRNPGRETSGESHSEGPEKTQSPCDNLGVESYELSETFLLIRTPEDKFYGEFHGQFDDFDFPEELLDDDPGNPEGGFG